ncbi:MAG: SOS response-associated peptidase [Lachnospiraceae bacterium]
MCGRYYLTEESQEELIRIVKILDHKIKIEKNILSGAPSHLSRDIVPTMQAPVLFSDSGSLSLALLQWGMHHPGHDRLMINARSESVLQKPFFAEAVADGRCIIPASGFYEWDVSSNRFTFTDPQSPLLYFAGLKKQQESICFTILTSAANNSMLPVHDRIPLVLDQERAFQFLAAESAAIELLTSTPLELSRSAEFEQLRLDFT